MASWTADNRSNADKQYFAQPIPVIERRRRIRSGGGVGGGGSVGGDTDGGSSQALDDFDIVKEFQHLGERE